MSKLQPYKNNNKFLISDRSSNYILRPVRVRKNKYPYTYTVENMGEDITVTIDRAWTPANHMILDFIGNQLWEQQYKKIEKNRNSWRNELSQSMLFNANTLVGYHDEKIPDELRQHVGKYLEYKKKQNRVIKTGKVFV